MRLITVTVAAALSLAGPALATAAAPTAADFYSKNNVKLLVGAGAGGGYDLYARIFAKYYGHYIPGHPTVVVENMPGGGGIKAANYLFNVAAKDGSVIEMPLPATLISEAIRPQHVHYHMIDFKWIGTISTMTDVLGVRAETGIKTIEDAKKKSIVIGSTSKFSQTSFQPALVNALLGTKFKIVNGYKSMNHIVIAMDRGEIGGHTDPWSSWLTQRPKLIKEGKIKLLLQFGPKVKKLTKVPAFLDLVKTTKDRNLVNFVGLMQVIGRSLAAPPGIPADRLAALRQAFDQAIKDPKFVAAVNKAHIQLRPRTGVSLAHAIDQMMASEKESAAALKAILKVK